MRLFSEASIVRLHGPPFSGRLRLTWPSSACAAHTTLAGLERSASIRLCRTRAVTRFIGSADRRVRLHPAMESRMHRGWYSRIRQLLSAQDRAGDQITLVALAVILAMIGVVGLASVAVSPAHRGDHLTAAQGRISP